MFKLFQLLNIGRQVSPDLKLAIAKMMEQLTIDAARTPGSADDQAVGILNALLSILGLYQ
jgi:hypothetical protein